MIVIAGSTVKVSDCYTVTYPALRILSYSESSCQKYVRKSPK